VRDVDRRRRIGDRGREFASQHRDGLGIFAGRRANENMLVAADADHICRLCDTQACPPAKCPVHQKALAVQAA
jgi:hypothetical protein